MSKINVREDKRESDTRKGFFIPNEYYQGNLNRAEKLEISGYDNAVANIEDFFLHLHTYKSELSAFFDVEKISEELSESSSEKISKQARMIKEIKVLSFQIQIISLHLCMQKHMYQIIICKLLKMNITIY